MTKTLFKTTDEYEGQLQLWKEVRATIKGKYSVMQLVSCLPKPQYKTFSNFSGMSDVQQKQAIACQNANAQRVKAYWSRGRLLNATSKTFEDLSGMIWSKEPEAELDTTLAYMEDNANGAGKSLREVAQDITDDVVSIGRYGVLVDMPDNEQGLTRAQMESALYAPRLIEYKAEQIIYTRLDELGRVAEVRLLEIKSEQKNEFDWEDKQYVRRLILIDGVYYSELYNENQELVATHSPRANGVNLDYIPFVFFGSDSNTSSFSKVPLYDLASANLGHFVLDCENRDNLHYHGQGATIVKTEMDPEEFMDNNPNGLDIGAKGVNMLRQGDDVSIVQIEATGALPAEMLRDEQRMIMAGAQLVTETAKNQTLGAKEIEVNTSMSTLKRIAKNVSQGIEDCLMIASEMLGSSTESKYLLNTEFITDKMTPEMLGKHIEMVQLGALPKETLNESARKVGFTTLEDDEIKDKSEADAAEMAGVSEAAALALAQQEANNE